MATRVSSGKPDLGDRYSGCTIAFGFTTASDCGPLTITGAPGSKSAGNCFVVCWKTDPNAWTCSTAGITESFNCKGALGWHGVSVNTNADPTFYSCGKDYIVCLHGGLAGTTCISYAQLATFSLKNRAGLNPTIHAMDLDVSATGEAGVDWANVGGKTTANALTCTTTFSVHSLDNSVDIGFTQQGLACTVWNETRARFGTCGTFGFLLDCAVHTVTPSITASSSFTEQGLACTVWNSVKANYGTCGTFGSLLDCAVHTVTPSVIATSSFTEQGLACTVWNSVQAKYGTCGTFGNLLDCAVHSVTPSTVVAASVSAAVTVGTNNDKTGYRLSATGVDDILDEAITEPAGVFAWAGATLRNITGWLGAMSSNRLTQDIGMQGLCDRAATLTIASATVTDDGTTAIRSSFITGGPS